MEGGFGGEDDGASEVTATADDGYGAACFFVTAGSDGGDLEVRVV